MHHLIGSSLRLIPFSTQKRMTPGEVYYKRSRFSTRLLEHRLYTAGHSWLERQNNGLWRVGLTKFAIRMLGDIVEIGFETKSGKTVETGQIVGWIENHKRPPIYQFPQVF